MPFTMGVGNIVSCCRVVCMTYLGIARFHIEIKHIFSLVGVLINLHQYKLQTNNFKKPNVFTNIGLMILSWVVRVTPKLWHLWLSLKHTWKRNSKKISRTCWGRVWCVVYMINKGTTMVPNFPSNISCKWKTNMTFWYILIFHYDVVFNWCCCFPFWY